MPLEISIPEHIADQEQALSKRSVNIEIDLLAIRANLATARRCSGGSRQFATIKADAYGHGAVAVAHALSATPSVEEGSADGADLATTAEGRADGFAVVSVDEALELRHSGITQPILVLQGPQSSAACADMQRFELWPVIHDMHQYHWYRQCVNSTRIPAWLKIDTGMGRLGVRPEQAIEILANKEGVQWMGLLTHFACADEPDNNFTLQQIERFHCVSHDLPLQRSMANSAAVLAWPQARSDWARPGIMLYGCNPLGHALPAGVQLKMAMTVSAPIISCKILPAGAGIGYAQTWRCPVEMPVAYVALGYRDGLPRVLDDTACVEIQGQRCPIVGRVSMDSVAVDLRSIPTARTGDIAVFWGENTPIDSLARAAGTINYELLTSIRGSRSYSAASKSMHSGATA